MIYQKKERKSKLNLTLDFISKYHESLEFISVKFAPLMEPSYFIIVNIMFITWLNCNVKAKIHLPTIFFMVESLWVVCKFWINAITTVVCHNFILNIHLIITDSIELDVLKLVIIRWQKLEFIAVCAAQSLWVWTCNSL